MSLLLSHFNRIKSELFNLTLSLLALYTFPAFSPTSHPPLNDLCCTMLSRVWLFAAPWTVAHQVPLSMDFPRQEYWSRLPFPTAGELSDLGIEPASLASPALIGGFFTTEPPGKP